MLQLICSNLSLYIVNHCPVYERYQGFKQFKSLISYVFVMFKHSKSINPAAHNVQPLSDNEKIFLSFSTMDNSHRATCSASSQSFFFFSQLSSSMKWKKWKTTTAINNSPAPSSHGSEPSNKSSSSHGPQLKHLCKMQSKLMAKNHAAHSLNVKAWILILDYSMYMLVGHGHLFTSGPTLYMHL